MNSVPTRTRSFITGSLTGPVRRLARPAALALAVLAGTIGAAWSQEAPPYQPATLIDSSMVTELRSILASKLVGLSIETQNRLYGELPQTEIDRLDKQWRSEREASDKPLIAATLSNPLSTFLTRLQANSVGLYAAIFVMDKNGLNVGQSAITGDFWQGDEAKFKKTFNVGVDAVFVDEPEYVEEFDIWIAQVNMTIASRKNGQPIGSATFDVNLNELARRRLGRS